MQSFRWDKQYETGLDEVDRQHHRLVDLINRFGSMVAESRDIARGEIEHLFEELSAYARYHFQEEEALMAEMGVDARHVNHHLGEHARFLQEVTNMRAAMAPDRPETTTVLLRFLTSWLAFHILGSDQSLARQIGAIRQGQPAADAFAAEERARAAATGPLLSALNRLFHTVTERNRQLFELNQTLEAKVLERTRELAIANRHLEAIALTDVLTGLPNRRHVIAQLGLMWAESPGRGSPLSCMMLDVDGFKTINDTWGHEAGDEVLRRLAPHLRDFLRTDDFVSRLGGDEFLIVCPGTTLCNAVQLAEALRRATSRLRVSVGAGEWRGSISIGVAERAPGMRRFEDLIKAADDALYEAKRSGRNRVAGADALTGI